MVDNVTKLQRGLKADKCLKFGPANNIHLYHDGEGNMKINSPKKKNHIARGLSPIEI